MSSSSSSNGNDPKRLLDAASALERSLLRAHRDESPSEDLEAKILAALGTTAAPITIDPPLSRAATTSWLKPLLYISGTVAVAAAVLVATRPAAPPQGQAPTASSPPTTTTSQQQQPKKEEVPKAADVKVVTPDSLPDARPPTSARVSPVTSQHSPTSAASSTNSPSSKPPSAVAREVEILDDVKAKLGSGEAAEAARGLSQYDREFPNDGGTLRPEATVLRIRMHLMQGDRPAAERVAQSFLSKHPDGVHAKRIRSLLGE